MQISVEVNEDDSDDDDDGMDVVSAVSEQESCESEEYETVTMASEAAPDPEKYDTEMDLDEEKVALEKIKSNKLILIHLYLLFIY